MRFLPRSALTVAAPLLLLVAIGAACSSTKDGGMLAGEGGVDASSDPDAPGDANVTPESSTDAPAETSTSQCPGNTKQKVLLVSAKCQAALDQYCCAQLKTCFDIVPPAGGSDCNAYAMCTASCNGQADPVACQGACDAAAPKSVITAYQEIDTCATNEPAAAAACL